MVALGVLGGQGLGRAAAGFALRFDGGDDYVTVPHSGAFNAYPLTITAWVKTLHSSSFYEAILNRYAPGSVNGYSLHTVNGRLYAWFFRDGANFLYPGDPGLDGGFIADGHWHHVAFVVNALGGSLYVDGNLRNSLAWTGTAGAPTANTDILIGKFSLTAGPFTNTFQGEIDEITLWNRALSANELNYLKHRRQSGREDGLLAYWRFNEGSGASVTNAAGPSHSGALRNGPRWVPSHAAVTLQPAATNCLKFNGINSYVEVPHQASLNAFPLTVTFWMKTADVGFTARGLVSKYADDANGYALILSEGRLGAWYFRDSFNYIWDGNFALDGGFVADDQWHHIALVIDASLGRLYVDGALRDLHGWVGTGGPTTTTRPLQFGRYFNYPAALNGLLDEIAIWNRALTDTEVQALKNLPLTGGEAGLLGYWRLNEGMGAMAADATGHGHAGSLLNGPAWVGSTAYLGDGSVHLVASPGIPRFLRQFAINTAPGENSFDIEARGFVRRFHDFGPTPPSTALATRFKADLHVAGTGVPVPVRTNATVQNFSLNAYNASTPQPAFFGPVAALSSVLSLRPEAGVQLDSVNHLHESLVTLAHSENNGAFADDGADITAAARLLHFNGRLFCGDIEAIITDVSNTPGLNTLFAPNYLQTQLQLSLPGAHIAGQTNFTFGGGGAFHVHLHKDGTATNLNGVFTVHPTGSLEAAGIRYALGPISLSSSGATANGLSLYFPTGFGYRPRSLDRRVLKGHFEGFALNPKLDAALRPISNLVFAATQTEHDAFYFAEESKPFWIVAPQLEWRVAEGRLHIAEAIELHYVREAEDNEVAAQRPNLVNPLAADRISNDGYYDNVNRIVSEPVSIRPDTNGAALLTMRAALHPSDYRPHFPYLNRNVGGHISNGGGELVIADDLINVNASYLVVHGTVPVPYGRDCSPESTCANFATNGPQVLRFTPQSSVLNFTPEGGLIAYGSILPTNLTWGFLGQTNYAQRTSDVEAGVYHVPGTFLRSDQTMVEDAHRPAALLFTGRGAETNSPYLERPDQPNYADGFANYAGLNFRRPAQGRSFVAGQDTGWYALTPRAKYYARYGGVSGIHEAASFTGNLNLYGYPFRFLSYRLSYLDSDNWESRTDGSTSVPYPSDFAVDFERMKFLCRGSLDSAQLPANTGLKHMVYWKADIQPFSIQFKPSRNDPCSLSNRFLVLGVEAKLPLVPQGLQAALGFKPNGNLVTLADAVAGVSSRFPLPANLELQGPGQSKYRLVSAAEGYFNNWERQPAMAAAQGGSQIANAPVPPPEGFYNVIAYLDVPFFRDIKVHLHLTPTGPDSAFLAMMGGWGAGLMEDQGWTINVHNPFSLPSFDSNHGSWPENIPITEYRASSTEKYRPRAQQNWLGVAEFDYPLAWNPIARHFAGYDAAEVNLPVMDVNSRLRMLSPGMIDLDFAQDVDIRFPRMKVLDFFNEVFNENNGPMASLSNVIHRALKKVLNPIGFRGLQNALREDPGPFFHAVLEPHLDLVTGRLYHPLTQAAALGKVQLLARTMDIVAADSNELRQTVMRLNGTATGPYTLVASLYDDLTDAQRTLEVLIEAVEKSVQPADHDGTPRRHTMRVLVRELVKDQGPALGFAADFTDTFLNSLLEGLDSTFAEIEAELRRVHDAIEQLRDTLIFSSGDFYAALEAANHDGQALTNYVIQAGTVVSNHLFAVSDPVDYFSADPSRARREIRESLLLAFLGSRVQGKYQTALRQHLSEPNFLLNQALSVLFDLVNRAVRNVLTEQATTALDNRYLNLKGSGALSTSLATARVRGSPIFNGDSLRLLHLDADVRMRVPDDMTFPAFLEIRELDSHMDAVSCIEGGTSTAEIILGAKEVPLDWAGVPSLEEGGQPLALDLEARWTLRDNTVRGIGGSLLIHGQAGFKGADVNYIGAALAIGERENYFAGKAAAEMKVPFGSKAVKIKAKFRAGIFAGRACTIEPLKFVDPEVEKVLLKTNDFSGIYLEYGGKLSLSEILLAKAVKKTYPKLTKDEQAEIEDKIDTSAADCLLDIEAKISTALYYQGGPRLGRIGARQKVGVEIKLLCVLEGRAEWSAFAEVDTAGKLTFIGKAKACGKVGVCPFCLYGCAELKFKLALDDDGLHPDLEPDTPDFFEH